MNDQTAWNAIASLRALLDLIPDTPAGYSKLHPCLVWVGRKLMPMRYAGRAVKTPPSTNNGAGEGSMPIVGKRLLRKPRHTDSVVIDDVAYDDSPENYDTFMNFLYAQTQRAEGQDNDKNQRITIATDPVIAYASPANNHPASEGGGQHVTPLWKTDWPLKAINEAMSNIRPMLPRILAAVDIAQNSKQRIMKAAEAEAGFLEEDMRGTFAADLEGSPESKAVMIRNDNRLKALSMLLRTLRTRPDVVVKVAVDMMLATKAELEGWEFNVSEGIIRYRGSPSAKLDSAAVLYVKVICAAAPALVPFSDFLKEADRKGVFVSTRKLEWVKKQIPDQYLSKLEFKTGGGARLKSEGKIY